MSANNFISIEQKGSKWQVWVRDDDTNQGSLRQTFDDKLAAIEYAQEIQDTELIEYGINIRNAMTWELYQSNAKEQDEKKKHWKDSNF